MRSRWNSNAVRVAGVVAGSARTLAMCALAHDELAGVDLCA